MLVVALALALPATAAAKGPVSAELCGPDECRAVAVALAFPYLEGAAGPPALRARSSCSQAHVALCSGGYV